MIHNKQVFGFLNPELRSGCDLITAMVCRGTARTKWRAHRLAHPTPRKCPLQGNSTPCARGPPGYWGLAGPGRSPEAWSRHADTVCPLRWGKVGPSPAIYAPRPAHTPPAPEIEALAWPPPGSAAGSAGTAPPAHRQPGPSPGSAARPCFDIGPSSAPSVRERSPNNKLAPIIHTTPVRSKGQATHFRHDIRPVL
jgi:hypothetical protein